MPVLAQQLSPLGAASRRREAGPSDADVQAFVAAAGLTDPTQLTALDQLAIDLKAAGVWTKLRAIYPFVGGSAAAHKWNLKDPRDLDAAFRIVWSGGWTHSADGALGNGSNTRGDTKFNPATHGFTSTNGSMAVYSRSDNNGPGNSYDLACSNGGDGNATILICRYNNNQAYFCFGTTGYAPNGAAPDGRGLFAANRVGGNSEGYRNGSRFVNVTDACVLTSLPLSLGCNNKGGNGTYHSSKQYAFASMGDTLTQQEQADFYAAVQTFQTTLGRQV